MMHLRRSFAGALLMALILSMLPLSFARASEAGRRNTTYALGGLTAYLAAKHKWVPAAVAGVGTAVAYHNYQAAVNRRHRRERYLALRHAYRTGFRVGDRVGRHHARVAYHHTVRRHWFRHHRLSHHRA